VAGLSLGEQPPGYRSGFVCLVGRPNVGKSTLLNQLLRSKVAITSDRPQTTRNAIRGVYTTDVAQIVFVDTPGLHKPHSALGTRLNRVVRNTLDEVEAIVFLVDVADGIGAGDEFIAKDLVGVSTPVIVALNKLDRVREDKLARAHSRMMELTGFECFPISARTGTGVELLLEAIVGHLPEGPVMYPPEATTDQPEKQIISELIREKLLERTSDELPHSIAVVVEEIRDVEGSEDMEIDAIIYVERDSQKGIVIGRGGKMLKEVGTRARRDIEALLGTHVFLHLRVKVERDWQRHETLVARFGYGE
jgi:GTP-binding protein Era